MAKPRKVQEPAAAYSSAPKKKGQAKTSAASKPQDHQVRYIDVETARKFTEQILDKHHELFRKLAQ